LTDRERVRDSGSETGDPPMNLATTYTCSLSTMQIVDRDVARGRRGSVG
jgi:hypothetical protein